MKNLVRLLVTLVAALLGLAPTTTGTAERFTYGAPTIARFDVHRVEVADSGRTSLGDVREESAWPAADARGSSTTPNARSNATESVSHSPYQVHIDPISGEGPMGIDTATFKSGATTANGGIRNSRAFWNEWQETYPGTLSETNQDLIASGRSPVVDEQWTQTFPETSVNEGETLVHHHLDCGPVAVPLPASVHGGTPGYSIWHSTC